MILSVTEIVVEERIRTDLGDDEETSELAASFLALGQLQPIVVTRNGDGYKLQAGERRLRVMKLLAEQGKAARYLQPGEIKAELLDDLPPHVQLQVEFDENMKRKDFSFVEKARFIRKFHETLMKQSGGVWTAEMTAASLRLSPASISHYLRIEEAMKTDEFVAKASTMTAAVKRMKVTEITRARKVEAEQAADDSLTRAQDVLKFGDAIQLIKTIPDNSIDLINFDPPWGDDTGHKSNENWEGFEDDDETSEFVINSLLPELFRVLKNDRFMVYWYRQWAYQNSIERLERIGFNFKMTRTPCIWYKPDKVSDQNRFPEKSLLNTYETFLLARKGEPIVHDRNRQNVFVFDRVTKGSLIHPTEKPLDLCDAIVKLCTVPGEKVLDPTAGSAAFLVSALRKDRKALGFELEAPFYDRSIVRLADLLKTRKPA